MFKKAEIEIYELDLTVDTITASGDPDINGDNYFDNIGGRP